ncbi:MAG: YhcH/YjgK/YiaL family protein [Butyricicoccus pullicaecorum]|nr:YhcH/YjgK/YiaL family protein [Butyricicoccus pullicaecorum]
MIADTLTHLSRYRGIHRNLDIAIDWLETHDPAELPDGRTAIDGEHVFINVMEADLRKAQGAQFEYHHRYADLQIDLTGSEYWEWSAAEEPAQVFDAETDVGFVSDTVHASGILGEGRFALFLPKELHKPSCIQGDCTHVRKAVVKIEMNE